MGFLLEVDSRHVEGRTSGRKSIRNMDLGGERRDFHKRSGTDHFYWSGSHWIPRELNSAADVLAERH